MQRLDRQINFITEIEKLKAIKRQNFTLDSQRQENSAEHSWHISIMAMVLLEQYNSIQLNQLKILKMLLIHDLGEIYDGDTFLYDDEARVIANEKEEIALKQLLSTLPNDQAKELFELWIEFEHGETEEAKFAQSIDALQPLLNHFITAPENYNPHDLKVQEVLRKKEIIKRNTPMLWTIAEEVIRKSVQKGLYI